LQTFRTKIFLTLSDDFSQRIASELCGKEEQLKLSYTLSENDQDARVGVLTGRATAHKATISTSKTYNLQRDWRLPVAFVESCSKAQFLRVSTLALPLRPAEQSEAVRQHIRILFHLYSIWQPLRRCPVFKLLKII
jgi:hypothetical protein